jgi:hypothetical protein
LREKLYPNRRLAQTLIDAASGLQAIHRAGLIHGHLTPDCLHCTVDGQVRITGLGETPPESQAADEPPRFDAASDVEQDLFDLGDSFAVLVTGKRPDLSKILARGDLAAWLCRQNRGLARPLANILERCLAPDLGRGFSSAKKLVAALKPLTDFEVSPADWLSRMGTHIYDLLILPIFLWLC